MKNQKHSFCETGGYRMKPGNPISHFPARENRKQPKAEEELC